MKSILTFFASVTTIILPHAAFAHHPLGGMMPETMWHGFLSGIGHPVIGFDHLAFIVAVGLISAFHSSRLVMPIAFIAGTVLGTLFMLSAVTVPAVEFIIALSVMTAGIIAMRGTGTKLGQAGALAAIAGLFHGYAYGEAVIGAEAGPVIAYLAGFGLIQFAIAAGTALVVNKMVSSASGPALQPRLAGAMIAGIGLFLTAEHLEGLVLAAI